MALQGPQDRVPVPQPGNTGLAPSPVPRSSSISSMYVPHLSLEGSHCSLEDSHLYTPTPLLLTVPWALGGAPLTSSACDEEDLKQVRNEATESQFLLEFSSSSSHPKQGFWAERG